MVFLLTKLAPDPPRLLTNVNKKMVFLMKASLILAVIEVGLAAELS